MYINVYLYFKHQILLDPPKELMSVYMCVWVCVYICVYVCMCVCVCVCVCVSMTPSTLAPAVRVVCVHTRVCVYVCVCVYTVPLHSCGALVRTGTSRFLKCLYVACALWRPRFSECFHVV